MTALQESTFPAEISRAESSLVARLGSALADWSRRRQKYRQVLRELRDLHPAELRELGIDPFRLEALARQAAGLRC